MMAKLARLLPTALIALGLALGVGLAVAQPPARITGFGSLAVTNTSTLLSTLTLGPNSATWPSPPQVVYVTNGASSAGLLYVCPFGGTCSAANGIPLSLGQSYGFPGPAPTMTVIAASTATAFVQFH